MSSNSVFPTKSNIVGSNNVNSSFLRPRTVTPSPLANHWSALCKVVLVRRLRHMFTIAGIISYLVLLGVVFDPRELPGSLFNQLQVLLFTPLAFLGAICIFVLRKQTLTTNTLNPPTVFSQILSILRTSNLPIFLAYGLGSTLILTAYIWCSFAVSTNPNLGFFSSSTGGDILLNERRIYISLLHLTTGLFGACSHIALGRSVLLFDQDSTLSIPNRLAIRAKSQLPNVISAVTTINGAFWLTYLVLRPVVLKFVRSHLAGGWIAPFLYSILKHNVCFSVTLIVRGLASTFLSLLIWETAHVCFDVYATQPMKVSQFGSNPNQCLLSGLRSTDPYFQHFAYLELSTLTLTDATRRKGIFTDIKPESAKGGAWQELSRECLKLIGEELQRAKGRPRDVAPPSTNDTASTSSVNSPSAEPPFGSPAHSIRNESIFRPVKKTFFDQLASSTFSTPPKPSTLSSSSNGNSSAVATSSSNGSGSNTVTSRVPSIFQTPQRATSGSTSSSVAATPITSSSSSSSPSKASLESKVANYVPKRYRSTGIYKRLFESSLEYRVGIKVTRRREVIWCIRSLSNLLCASLSEDPYGVVQGDIPKVLEAFVLYLMALETLSKSFLSGLEEGRVEKLNMEKQLEGSVGLIEEALKDGIRMILEEFQPFLKEFRFPPRIASRLQLLVDWG